jgi:hypothetical protein
VEGVKGKKEEGRRHVRDVGARHKSSGQREGRV